jgi:hypothetical protein
MPDRPAQPDDERQQQRHHGLEPAPRAQPAEPAPTGTAPAGTARAKATPAWTTALRTTAPWTILARTILARTILARTILARPAWTVIIRRVRTTRAQPRAGLARLGVTPE